MVSPVRPVSPSRRRRSAARPLGARLRLLRPPRSATAFAAASRHALSTLLALSIKYLCIVPLRVDLVVLVAIFHPRNARPARRLSLCRRAFRHQFPPLSLKFRHPRPRDERRAFTLLDRSLHIANACSSTSRRRFTTCVHRSTPDATPSPTRRTPHPASCVPEIASSGSSASTSNLSLPPSSPASVHLAVVSPSFVVRSFDRPFPSLPTSFASRRANASTASNDRHLRERRRARERTKTARAFESTRVRVGRQSAASNDRARVRSIYVVVIQRAARGGAQTLTTCFLSKKPKKSIL